MTADQAKKPSRILRALLIIAMLIVVGVGGGGYIYVNQAGGLRLLLETKLLAMAGGGNVAVGDVRIGFAASRQPLHVNASNIVVTLDESQIDLPGMQLKFGLDSLFHGRPSSILLKGLKLDLVKNEKGWSASPAVLFFGHLGNKNTAKSSSKGQGKDVASRFAGIKQIAIESDRMSLSYADRDLPPVVFSDIHIDIMSFANRSISGSMRALRLDDDGNNAGSFTIALDGMPDGKNMVFDLTASKLMTANISDYVEQMPNILRQPGYLSGHLGLEIKDSIIRRLNADIDLVDGVLDIPGFGPGKPSQRTDFQTANLIFTYLRAENRLDVAKADLNITDTKGVSFRGTVNQLDLTAPSVVGTIEAQGFTSQALLDGWPTTMVTDLRQKVQNQFSGGLFKRVEAEFKGNFIPKTNQLTLSKLNFSSAFQGIRASLSAGQYQRLVSTIDGNLGMRIVEGGAIEDITLDLTLKDGSMLVTGYNGIINLPDGNLRAVLRGNLVTLQAMGLSLGALGSFAIDGSLKLGKGWSLHDLKLALDVPDMDAALFSALWPSWAAQKTRDWVVANIPAGRVRQSRLTLAADLNAAEDVRKIYGIEGDINLRDATVFWHKDALPLTNVDADLRITADEFSASFLAGRINDLAVQRGRLVIAPMLEDLNKNVAVNLTAKGGLATALQVVQQAGMSRFGGINLGKADASGQVEFTMRVDIPIEGDNPPHPEKTAVMLRQLDASISAGALRNLPNQLSIDDAELVINIADDLSQIIGTAAVYGAPGEFSLQIDHANNQVELTGQVPSSPQLAIAIGALTGVDVAGSIGGKLEYSGDPTARNAQLNLTLDLQKSSIDVPQINWAKLPVESGRATMALSLRNGEIDQITNINITAGSLSAQGQVVFATLGQVQAAFFERVAWPGNDLRDLIIEASADQSWKVGASARLVNLQPLRGNEGVSGGKALAFDFTADQIVVDNSITLSGQLNGTRNSDGHGRAEFLGSLLVRGKPLLTEANLEIVFGPLGETVIGTGLIGGGEVHFDYQSPPDGIPQLILNTKNAGRVLAGLGITETVRSGVMRLTNQFRDKVFQSYDTRIELNDFSIVEAPRALRVFSVLSVAGLYSLVQGDGTAFERGLAVFETRGSEVKIVSLKARGAAVGLSMLGVYDRLSKQLDVSGNLVPINQISQLLGDVPVLGDLITGVDKLGIFVTQFKLTGPIDKPVTEVNPVSSFAPGVIRDLFSPNWLGNEKKRLLGPTSQE